MMGDRLKGVDSVGVDACSDVFYVLLGEGPMDGFYDLMC